LIFRGLFFEHNPGTIFWNYPNTIFRSYGAGAEIGPRLNIKYGFNWASKKIIYGWTLFKFKSDRNPDPHLNFYLPPHSGLECPVFYGGFRRLVQNRVTAGR